MRDDNQIEVNLSESFRKMENLFLVDPIVSAFDDTKFNDIEARAEMNYDDGNQQKDPDDNNDSIAAGYNLDGLKIDFQTWKLRKDLIF